LKIGIVSDIHGNLVALESILSEINEADEIVCLGDVAATGPQPRETIDFLRKAKWPCVMGNTDERLANSTPEDFKHIMPEEEKARMVALDRWTAGQLDDSAKNFISSFKPTIVIDAGNNSILCYHGSPRSNTEQILPTTDDNELTKIFGGMKASIYAGGHIHSQLVRKLGRSIIINPGSVGLPYLMGESGRTWNPAWAEYAIVISAADDLRIELHRSRYSLAALKDVVRKSGMPDPDWWLRDWV
jgi:putative phosphoesterase